MFTLPQLPYDFNALEPHIDAKTMEIHYTKHHQAYVDKLNTALTGHEDLMAMDITQLVSNLHKVPEGIRTAVGNNGGGHCNHSIFWTLMSPSGGGEPNGELAKAIHETFTSFEQFKAKFKAAATSRFGSGWAWLCQDPDGLHICSTANQDNPLAEGHRPILGLDVWEHAYYLSYQNRRPDYIDAWWNVVNWSEVERRYEEG